VALVSDELKARIDSERNQGRAPDMGWLDHDRLGFNYRLSDIACAIGIAQLGRLERMFAERGRMAGWYRRALAGVEGLQLPCVDHGGARRGWCVFVVQLPAGSDRDRVAPRRQEASLSEREIFSNIFQKLNRSGRSRHHAKYK
jgi:perosamine synthetase